MLGANDGILSTASLVPGVAASGASGGAIVVAGAAGLVAGALSMAAGEHVLVSSQRDAEQADMRLEARARPRPAGRAARAGRDLRAARPAAGAGHRGGGLAVAPRRAAAHARDELGLDEARLARPFQAAWTSALAFSAAPRCRRSPPL